MPGSEKHPYESQSNAQAKSTDGYVELRSSDDRMLAVASFYPPRGAGKQIVAAEVREQLTARGLRFGIDWDAINSSTQACADSHKTIANVEIAHGSRPSDEVSSHLEIEPSLLNKESPGNPEALAVDFKTVSPFQLVKKGHILARTSPRVDGVPGTDVTGVAFPYGKSARRSPRPGKNTLAQGDTVVAGCDGKFVASEDSFWVSEVLEIPGDVDYSTGHIDFPGDVVVYGQIKQGFKVKAGGSLTCAKTIDASEVSCGGDGPGDPGSIAEHGQGGRADSREVHRKLSGGGRRGRVCEHGLPQLRHQYARRRHDGAEGRDHWRQGLRPKGRDSVPDRELRRCPDGNLLR